MSSIVTGLVEENSMLREENAQLRADICEMNTIRRKFKNEQAENDKLKVKQDELLEEIKILNTKIIHKKEVACQTSFIVEPKTREPEQKYEAKVDEGIFALPKKVEGQTVHPISKTCNCNNCQIERFMGPRLIYGSYSWPDTTTINFRKDPWSN